MTFLYRYGIIVIKGYNGKGCVDQMKLLDKLSLGNKRTKGAGSKAVTLVVNGGPKDDFLEYAATQIKSDHHKFSYIEDYLKTHHNAIPYTLSEKQLTSLKINVITNNYRHLLNFPAPLGDNPTEKQIKEYMEQDTSTEQARNYPAEKLALDMRAYKIPVEGNEEAIIEIEMRSEYMCFKNVPDKIAEDVILWLGVTQEDIEKRTTRFVRYALISKGIKKVKNE